jgi:hypothetical protein
MANYLKSQTDFVWGKQFGSEKDEYALNHLIDSNGNIYITGSTTGILSKQKFGKEDIFIVKYNPHGEMEWSGQFGTDSADIARGIYADNKGYIYVTGMTGGKLGQNSFGKTDCFIMKLDTSGNQVFISQFGSPVDDCSYAITKGAESDIFVCGTTWGDLAGKNKGFIDGFTGQFTSNGDLIRYNQFGSEGFDIAMIVRIDIEKNIYIGGSTSGNFGCQQIGEGDGFLLKTSEKGDILWNNQFGTNNHDGVRGIDFNHEISDNILVSGIFNLPPAQGFIRMFKKNGELLWERKFIAVGKNSGTSGKDVSIDAKGNLYHMGLTGANIFGPLIGENDVYLVKLGLDNIF